MNSAASPHKRVHLISKTLTSLLLAISLTVLQFAITCPAQAQIALSQPLVVKWRYESDRTTNLTPASDKNTVYLPLAEGVLIALNSADGKLIWKAETGGEFSASPAADERSVFVPTQYAETKQGRVHGTLRALSKSTGVTLWMRTLPAPLAGSLVAGPSALFAGSADGRVYAFDKRTGLTLWINQYGEEFSSQPALAGHFVYLGSEGGTLLALDQATGALVWQYRARARIPGPIAIAK